MSSGEILHPREQSLGRVVALGQRAGPDADLLVALVVMALSEMTWAAQKKAGATGAGSGSRAATTTAGSAGAAAAWASRVNILALLTVLNVVVAALWRSYS
jgi:hypothetical protein